MCICRKLLGLATDWSSNSQQRLHSFIHTVVIYYILATLKLQHWIGKQPSGPRLPWITMVTTCNYHKHIQFFSNQHQPLGSPTRLRNGRNCGFASFGHQVATGAECGFSHAVEGAFGPLVGRIVAGQSGILTWHRMHLNTLGGPF